MKIGIPRELKNHEWSSTAVIDISSALVKGFFLMTAVSLSREQQVTVTLRVLCWDHPRCSGPMAAAARTYAGVNPGVPVRLHARPLTEFNDQPVWEVAPSYDLIFVDHPITGAAAERKALVPLDDLLSDSDLHRIANEAIGDTHRSYTWDNHQWALGVDATTQVAAIHCERLHALGVEVPRTWDDVLALVATPHAVALPLYSSGAICTLISLSANASHATGAEPTWLRRDAVEMLVDLVGLVDPICYDFNPPSLLAWMRDDASAAAYVPFVFGYAACETPAHLHRRPRHGRTTAGSDLGWSRAGYPALKPAPQPTRPRSPPGIWPPKSSRTSSAPQEGSLATDLPGPFP